MTKAKKTAKKAAKKAVKKRPAKKVAAKKVAKFMIPNPKFKTGETVAYKSKDTGAERPSRVRGWPKWEAEAKQWRYDLVDAGQSGVRYNVPETAMSKAA